MALAGRDLNLVHGRGGWRLRAAAGSRQQQCGRRACLARPRACHARKLVLRPAAVDSPAGEPLTAAACRWSCHSLSRRYAASSSCSPSRRSAVGRSAAGCLLADRSTRQHIPAAALAMSSVLLRPVERALALPRRGEQLGAGGRRRSVLDPHGLLHTPAAIAAAAATTMPHNSAQHAASQWPPHHFLSRQHGSTPAKVGKRAARRAGRDVRRRRAEPCIPAALESLPPSTAMSLMHAADVIDSCARIQALKAAEWRRERAGQKNAARGAANDAPGLTATATDQTVSAEVIDDGNRRASSSSSSTASAGTSCRRSRRQHHHHRAVTCPRYGQRSLPGGTDGIGTTLTSVSAPHLRVRRRSGQHFTAGNTLGQPMPVPGGSMTVAGGGGAGHRGARAARAAAAGAAASELQRLGGVISPTAIVRDRLSSQRCPLSPSYAPTVARPTLTLIMLLQASFDFAGEFVTPELLDGRKSYVRCSMSPIQAQAVFFCFCTTAHSRWSRAARAARRGRWQRAACTVSLSGRLLKEQREKASKEALRTFLHGSPPLFSSLCVCVL
jgi:hypothetical protein